MVEVLIYSLLFYPSLSVVIIHLSLMQMNLLLMEYLSSGDKQEAIRCLLELEVPHFNHELVYEAIIMVLERADSQSADMMSALLQHMAAVTVLTSDQLNKASTHTLFRTLWYTCA